MGPVYKCSILHLEYFFSTLLAQNLAALSIVLLLLTMAVEFLPWDMGGESPNSPDQRRALLRGLTTQLFRHSRIKTTRARASAMRKYIDKMITLAKDGTLHKRREALGFIYEKQIVHALFAEVPDRYGERNGGYTRIVRTLPTRQGDNAPMAYIELV